MRCKIHSSILGALLLVFLAACAEPEWERIDLSAQGLSLEQMDQRLEMLHGKYLTLGLDRTVVTRAQRAPVFGQVNYRTKNGLTIILGFQELSEVFELVIIAKRGGLADHPEVLEIYDVFCASLQQTNTPLKLETKVFNSLFRINPCQALEEDS